MMHRMPALVLPFLLLAASAPGARATGLPPQGTSPGATAATEDAAASHDPSSPADSAMMSGMATMQREMADAPRTGNPDRDFVAMMEPHHQGAIEMARAELRYGRDPELRRMARNIIAAQDREITEMRNWQASHPG